MRPISSMTLRLFVVFAALALAVVGSEPPVRSTQEDRSTPPTTLTRPAAPAQNYERVTVQGCNFRIQGFNRDRYVEGAPHDAECLKPLRLNHSAPFGNWGVSSNIGVRTNSHQFAGWCRNPNSTNFEQAHCRTEGDGTKWQWNSCKKDYPAYPMHSHLYNARVGQSRWNTHQRGRDTVERYGAVNMFREAEGDTACEDLDGMTLTLDNNYMRLYELDWSGDTYVGILEFPDISVPLRCDIAGCDYVESAIVSPVWRDGVHDDPNARIHLSAIGYFMEKEIFSGYVDDDSTTQDSLPASGLGAPRSAPSPFPSPEPGLSSLPSGSSSLSATEAVGELDLQVKRRDTKAPVAHATVLFVEEDDNNIRIRSLRLGDEGRGALRARGSEMKEIVVFADGFGGSRKKVFPTTSKSTVSVELEQGGMITGIVFSPQATPIADAEVRVVYASEIRRRGEVRSRIQADFHRGTPITGTDGVFAILDVRPGVVFKLEVSHEEGNVTLGPFNLRPGQKLENLQLVIR